MIDPDLQLTGGRGGEGAFIPSVMHLSMSSPRGGGSGIGWGFWHFLKKIIKIPTPGQRIIVKISRNKWFTSHLLFKIDRSNAWCQVKISTPGICVTVKFPWVAIAQPPPLGLDIDRCIISSFFTQNKGGLSSPGPLPRSVTGLWFNQTSRMSSNNEWRTSYCKFFTGLD